MSTYSLPSVFQPRSIAVVGGSPRDRSVGRAVLRNLREAGFAGAIGLVNPRHLEIEGFSAVAHLSDLPFTPELVVIATPLSLVADILQAAAAKGASAAVLMS